MKRYSRRWVLGAMTLAATLVAVADTRAITNGEPDAGRHPYVGLMIALDEEGVPSWRCSVSLLSPTLALTAAHCVEPPADHVEIWFAEGPVPVDPDYLAALQADPDGVVSCYDSPLFDSYPCQGDAGGTPIPHPDYCVGCGPGLPGAFYRDVGVVVLDEPVPASVVGEYAVLPTPDLVSTLPNKTAMDFVGFGVSVQAQIPGSQLPQPPPFYRWTGPRTRKYAPSELVSGNFKHSGEYIRIAMNPGGGSGGTCFGDSGGPDLLGGTDIVLGVNSYVTNVNCAGVGYAQRVDVPDVLNWILSYF